MHDIEPFYNWRHLYISEEDEKSPFYGREHSEFEFTQTVYNYYIHPQWDDFGSKTLYIKCLFVDYDQGFCILEFIGEWNDAIENDIMTLKRELIDRLIDEGIGKFILIGENVLNFHSSDNCYYEEWYEDIQENGGWIAFLDLPEQSQYDFKKAKINRYIELLDYPAWRTVLPQHLFTALDNFMMKRLGNS
ncbi:MAG: hypothetical protein ACO29O_03305 [Chitinophagaceae bacterium]